jgi:hypothetical protein
MISAEVLAVDYAALPAPGDQLPEGQAGPADAYEHFDDGLGLTFWIRRADAAS